MTAATKIALLSLAVIGATCISVRASAETPWCSEAIRIEAPMILYPPIARAAHIAGTVIGRITLSPEGTVQNFAATSGPVMLATAVQTQVKNWTFKPQESNRRACQVILIASFTIDEDRNPDTTPAPSNGVKVWTNAKSLVVYTTNYSKAAE